MARITLDKACDRARQVATSVARPSAAEVDRAGRWPEQTLRALQAADLGGLVVPEEHGGCGLGLLAVAQVCEEVARECASSAMCFGMHCVGAAVVAAKATPGQVQDILEPIVAGRHLTTLALSEPGTGAHFWLPETTMDATGDAWRINGRKSFVTNGGHADSYVVSTVAADPGAAPGQFSCVVVPAGTPGLLWGEPWKGSGMRGNSSIGVQLRDVLVPPQALLGAEGEQIWYVFNVVAPYFLTAMAGTYLGVAAAACEEARLHLIERRYSQGTRLAQHPVLQHRLGEVWADVERSRRLIYFAAEEADRGGPDALPALCSAKADVADMAVRVANEAMTLAGGIGYREGGTFERHLRDARAAHVMSPTTDLLRTWTGRALLGENLLAE